MSGVSRLRHVAAMNPAGRGSISTEEARQVCAELDAARARLAALEALVRPTLGYLDQHPGRGQGIAEALRELVSR